MEELSIDSIRVSLSNYQRVVILKLKSKEMFIPIWVGPSEADAIAIKLQKVSLPRPLTHDLVISLLESLSISIEYVLIESMKDETFFAKIAIKNQADYIAFGAFNSSKTKKVKFKANIKLINKAKKLIKIPIVAIGGINDKNYNKLLLNKVNFLAISGYIWNNKKLKPIDAIKKLK